MYDTGTSEYGMPTEDVIRARKSVRSYIREPLSEEIKNRLTYYFYSLKGPFEGSVRMKMVDTDIALYETKAKIGTYGVIKGASSYIVSATKDEDHNLEDLGYVFEKLILFATSMGIGTCWMGGTFKRNEFIKTIDLKADEILPIISPFGVPATRMSLREKLMRYGVGSDRRKPWKELFFEGDFNHPLTQKKAGKYQQVLEMVRLAPSASNLQPWRIILENNMYHFFVIRTKDYEKTLGFDMHRIDMGIAMCHFELTAKEAGINGEWILTKHPIEQLSAFTQYLISWVSNA